MRLAYPATLDLYPNTLLVSFPDIPEALTEGPLGPKRLRRPPIAL